MDQKTTDFHEENKNSDINNYRRNSKDNNNTNVNRFFKQTSASPNSFIPLTTTNKIDKIASSNYNYSNSNLSSNFSKREISKDKSKPEIISLRPNNFIPETTKSPIKIFSPSNKTLVLSTKNKYSNLGNKIESFFNKKDPIHSKKSASPRRNNFDDGKKIHIDIRSVDKVKPMFNYKNNKPNTLKLYTKAISPNNETPRNINDTNKAINTTKNKPKDLINKEGENILKDKIYKFCKKNNFEINEV